MMNPTQKHPSIHFFRGVLMLCSLVFIQINSFAQNPYHQWSGEIMVDLGPGAEYQNIEVSQDGYLYVAGSGFGDLDSDPNIIVEYPNTKSFIIKLDSNRNLIWSKPFVGDSFGDNITVNGVKQDTAGLLYLYGNYKGTVDFDPGPGVYNLPTTSYELNGYVVKLDTSGNFIWAKCLEANDKAEIIDIAFNSMNEMTLIGEFEGEVDLDPGAGTISILSTNPGTKDGFIVKMTGDMNWIWHRIIETNAYFSFRSIEVDLTDNAYCSMKFNGTIDLDPGVGTNLYTKTGIFHDSAILKFSPNGTVQNEIVFQSNDANDIYSIGITPQNDILLAGHFQDLVDIDPSTAVQTIDPGNGNIFLIKYDANFNLIWSRNFGPTIDVSSNVFDILIDQMENIYLGGYAYGPADLDPGVGSYMINGGASISFFSKLTPNGDFIWGQSFDGGANDKVRSLAIDNSGNLYVSGRYYKSDYLLTDFDPSPQEYYFPAPFNSHWRYYSRFKLCNSNQPPLPDTLNLTDYYTPCQVDSLPEPTAVHDCYGQMIGIPDVSFPFYEIGDTVVTWTYDDGWGNVSSQVQTIHITGDFNGPTPNISSLSVYEDYCEATPPTPDATDDCKGLIVGTTNVQFPINVVGDTIITWQYDDGHGNITYQDQLITVHADTTAPDPLWPSLPDLWGTCQVDSSSFIVDAIDQCSGQIIYGVPSPSFPITTPGWSQITWTFTDNDGHESYQTQDVYVNAGSGPSFIDSEYTINANCQLDTLPAPQATDFCDTLVDVSTNQIFPITSQGTTTVQYTATNDNGATTDFFVTVIIDDTVAPSIDGNQLQMQTAICEYDTTFTPTAFDSCSGVVLGVPNITFPMTQIGIDTISWTFTDANGNQSTAEQIIEIIDLDNTISINGFDLSANQSNANYQWLDCKTWTPIAGEVNQTYTPIENGEYAVIIFIAGCTDTSDCFEIEGIGLSELSNQIKIYPNPSQGKFTLQLDDVKTAHVEVTDLHGKLLISTSIDSKSTVFDLSSFERGVYFVHVNNENGHFIKRLVLE